MNINFEGKVALVTGKFYIYNRPHIKLYGIFMQSQVHLNRFLRSVPFLTPPPPPKKKKRKKKKG